MKFFTLAFFMLFSLQLAAKDYDVLAFGVKADGRTLSTNSIQKAIDYVNEQGGGRLVFTAGKYLTGSIYLKSNVTLHLERGAIILGSTNPFDYDKRSDAGNWTSLLFAIKQKNIGITGPGMIDGRGFTNATNLVDLMHREVFILYLGPDKTRYQDPMKYDRPQEMNRPQNVYFRECENVTITDITLKDPASWNQTYDQCKNVYVDNIYVDSKSYWNNDGIDIVDCDGVVIKNSFFDAADDVICFKSHDPNVLCQNVVVDNCVGRSSANGLKFGTVSRGGFKNFKVTNITIYDTYRSAVTFAAVDGAEIENIHIDGVRSINTGNVFYFQIGDRWSKGKRPYMKDVLIENVYAEVPMFKADAGYGYEGPIEDMPRNISPASVIGMPDNPIENMTFRNIEIVYPGAGNPYFAYVGLDELNKIPELPAKYPEFSMYLELPAWGFYVRHAKNIKFENMKLRAEAPDYRVGIVLDQVDGATLKNVTFEEPEAGNKNQVFADPKSKNVVIE